MAKLVLSRAGSIVHQSFVDRARVTIGRETHNDIAVDDAAVSREHAAIVPIGHDHILEDLGSANGTIVNGVRVTLRVLQHGDVIELGDHRLRYLNPRSTSAIDLERTMLIPTQAVPAEAPHDAGAPAEAGPAVATTQATRTRFPGARARMLIGPRAGTTVELDRVVTTFGTPGKGVAVITRRPHGFFVAHVEGRRRTRLNGAPLRGEVRQLSRGDLVDAGGERLEFWPD